MISLFVCLDKKKRKDEKWRKRNVGKTFLSYFVVSSCFDLFFSPFSFATLFSSSKCHCSQFSFETLCLYLCTSAKTYFVFHFHYAKTFQETEKWCISIYTHSNGIKKLNTSFIWWRKIWSQFRPLRLTLSLVLVLFPFPLRIHFTVLQCNQSFKYSFNEFVPLILILIVSFILSFSVFLVIGTAVAAYRHNLFVFISILPFCRFFPFAVLPSFGVVFHQISLAVFAFSLSVYYIVPKTTRKRQTYTLKYIFIMAPHFILFYLSVFFFFGLSQSFDPCCNVSFRAASNEEHFFASDLFIFGLCYRNKREWQKQRPQQQHQQRNDSINGKPTEI